MRKPKMILFDYGQTLVNEGNFDGVRGTEAVLAYATKNPNNLTAEQVQAEADRINNALGRFDISRKDSLPAEIPNHMFTRFLYESLEIELSLTSDEIDRIFFDAASPGTPTEGINDFLSFLTKNGIRTGVISNIAYSGAVVEERIYKYITNHRFDFILASSEYLYRKPKKEIFSLALTKAKLFPEDIWFIGDQWTADIEGSKAAGMFPVWYTGAINEKEPRDSGTLTVDSYTELQKLLEMVM